MRWERLFEDLQDQFASEWEAERAALDTEAERLRLARLPLRARLAVPAAASAAVRIDLPSGEDVAGTLDAVGEDWLGVGLDTGGAALIRAEAVLGVRMPEVDLLHSAREVPAPPRSLAERMPFAFVLRDLARRRDAVRVHRVDGSVLAGTIDRAGADHFDLAVHEPGTPRRAAHVTGFRMVPCAATAWVRVDERRAR
ncbi:hypothetical protein [Microbacterium sp. GXF7504]